ncbi:MAG TPA: TRAP transporter small permease [Burkholderiaceae bacterium]|nr:TRAP transporter small permease [Burkholderiaceae bacterium]
MLARVLEAVIVVSLAIMALLVFGNVVLRYAFNSGIAISEELSRLLFVWLIFLGAILASAQHAHIGFDTLVKSLPATGRKILVIATGGLMLAASVIFIVGGWQQTVINLDNTYPVLGISYAWLYAVAIVFGIGTLVTISVNIGMVLTGKDLALTQDLGDRIEEKLAQVATDEQREPPR